LITVGGTRLRADSELIAHVYVDLQFDDGHVERWVGPAAARGAAGTSDIEVVLRWAQQQLDAQLLDELLAELRRHPLVANQDIEAMRALPIEHVVRFARRQGDTS
jgi:hypothetical protein